MIRPKKKRRVEETPLKTLKRLIKELEEEDEERFQTFGSPVDDGDLPNYREVIKKPMDFGTIQKKIDSNEYDDVDSAIKDVALVWKNCYIYNSPQNVKTPENISWIVSDAIDLQTLLVKYMESSEVFTPNQISMTMKPQPTAAQKAIVENFKNFGAIQESQVDEGDDEKDDGDNDNTHDNNVNDNNDNDNNGKDDGDEEVDGNKSNTPVNVGNNNDDDNKFHIRSVFPINAPDLDTLLGPEQPGDRDVLSGEELDFIMRTLAVVPKEIVDSVLTFVQRASPHTVDIVSRTHAVVDISLFEVPVQRRLLNYLKDCKKNLDSKR